MRISDWSSDVCSSDLAALTQPSEAAEDCLIVAESAITREQDEFVENTSDIMFEVRPLEMAGVLRLLPGRKLVIGVGHHLVRPALKPLNFRVYIEHALIGGITQFRATGRQRRYRIYQIRSEQSRGGKACFTSLRSRL